MKQPWRYCGPLGRGPIGLVFDALRGGRAPAWDHFADREIELTCRCTAAIHRQLLRWGIGRGDEVLMPSYHCGSEVDAVLASGANVVLYRVGCDRSIDREDLLRRMNQRTRVVYIIHYFGWAHDLRDVARACRRYGTKLLEDCALSLFSEERGEPLGRAGDAAVFSLTKTLGITDGGVLSAPTGGGPPPGHWPLAAPRRALVLTRRSLARRLDRVALSRLSRRLSRQPRPSIEPEGPKLMPAGYFYNRRVTRTPMSRCARGTANHANQLAIVERRRRNFARLATHLETAGIEPACPALSAATCPLFLPLLVQQRQLLVRELAEYGIEAIAWWAGYHPSIDLSHFPDAQYLKDHLLALPVHQDLDDADIDHIGRCFVKAVAASSMWAVARAEGSTFVSSGCQGDRLARSLSSAARA